VDLASEKILQILLDSHKIEQRSAGLEIDEQVEIAVWSRESTGDRAKDPDSCRSICCRDAKNFGSLVVDQIFDRHVSAPEGCADVTVAKCVPPAATTDEGYCASSAGDFVFRGFCVPTI
jgi:hypothetical protein